MKTVLAAILAASLVLPSSSFAADKKDGQALQLPQAQTDKPNMTRRYRAKHQYRTQRRYRTAGYRYRAKHCDPLMRQWFGVCN